MISRGCIEAVGRVLLAASIFSAAATAASAPPLASGAMADVVSSGGQAREQPSLPMAKDEVTSAAAAPLPDSSQAPADNAIVQSDVLARYLTRSKSSVYFVRNSLILTSEALATIAENADRLKADRDMTVTLIGYIEDMGSQSYNVALATQRTSVIREALIGMGVPVRQIRSSIINREPPDTVPCETELCRASYRRVEFAYAGPR